jgi:hypothetical protein
VPGQPCDLLDWHTPVIEVNAVFAVAAAFRLSHSLSHAESLQLGSRNGSHAKPPKLEQSSDLRKLGWS